MTLKLYTYGPKAHFGGVKNIGYYNLGEHFLSQNQLKSKFYYANGVL